MFQAGDRVGVGVSGGADSVALLLLLEELRDRLGIELAVLHFNHQLRGAESDADEEFVAALAAQRGMDFLAGRGDVAGAARDRGWNLEDAARRLRYAFFSSVVRAGRVTRVAVAHTADDQAETVLARLVRGTGPAGLAAIYPGERSRGSAAARSAAQRIARVSRGPRPVVARGRLESGHHAFARPFAPSGPCRSSSGSCSLPSWRILAAWRKWRARTKPFGRRWRPNALGRWPARGGGPPGHPLCGLAGAAGVGRSEAGQMRHGSL